MIAGMLAEVAQGISAAFGGPYHPARVIDQQGATYDEGGSLIPGTPVVRACMAQVDAVTDAMRQADGFTERDMRILVLAATLDGGIDTDARVEVLAGPHAGIWMVHSVDRDPMGAYYELRGRRG